MATSGAKTPRISRGTRPTGQFRHAAKTTVRQSKMMMYRGDVAVILHHQSQFKRREEKKDSHTGEKREDSRHVNQS